MRPPENIYDPEYVRRLFDHMSDSYDRVNLVSSFGFSRRWRRQAVERLRLEPGMRVGDLMAGAGEAWAEIVAQSPGGEVLAVDFSQEMLRRGARRRQAFPSHRIHILQADALEPWHRGAPLDALVVAFGVKTLAAGDQQRLAQAIKRLLKPGGRFSIIEVSLPRALVLRTLFGFYIGRVIPLVGRLFLGDSRDYRMLGRYTSLFGDCRAFAEVLRTEGLEAQHVSYFFGCATGIVGRTPANRLSQRMA